MNGRPALLRRRGPGRVFCCPASSPSGLRVERITPHVMKTKPFVIIFLACAFTAAVAIGVFLVRWAGFARELHSTDSTMILIAAYYRDHGCWPESWDQARSASDMSDQEFDEIRRTAVDWQQLKKLSPDTLNVVVFTGQDQDSCEMINSHLINLAGMKSPPASQHVH